MRGEKKKNPKAIKNDNLTLKEKKIRKNTKLLLLFFHERFTKNLCIKLNMQVKRHQALKQGKVYIA